MARGACQDARYAQILNLLKRYQQTPYSSSYASDMARHHNTQDGNSKQIVANVA